MIAAPYRTASAPARGSIGRRAVAVLALCLLFCGFTANPVRAQANRWHDAHALSDEMLVLDAEVAADDTLQLLAGQDESIGKTAERMLSAAPGQPFRPLGSSRPLAPAASEAFAFAGNGTQFVQAWRTSVLGGPVDVRVTPDGPEQRLPLASHSMDGTPRVVMSSTGAAVLWLDVDQRLVIATAQAPEWQFGAPAVIASSVLSFSAQTTVQGPGAVSWMTTGGAAAWQRLTHTEPTGPVHPLGNVSEPVARAGVNGHVAVSWTTSGGCFLQTYSPADVPAATEQLAVRPEAFEVVADGTVLLAGRQLTAPRTTSLSVATRPPSGSVSPFTAIYTPPSTDVAPREPVLQVSRTGHALLSWTTSGFGEDSSVHAAVRPAGGVWGQVTQLASARYADGLSAVGLIGGGISDSGDAAVLWSRGVSSGGSRTTTTLAAGFGAADRFSAQQGPVWIYPPVPGGDASEPVPGLSGMNFVNVGDTVTCSRGYWQRDPTSISFQWRTPDGVIAGATSPTFTLGPEHNNSYVYCDVTAANHAGATTAPMLTLVVGHPPDYGGDGGEGDGDGDGDGGAGTGGGGPTPPVGEETGDAPASPPRLTIAKTAARQRAKSVRSKGLSIQGWSPRAGTIAVTAKLGRVVIAKATCKAKRTGAFSCQVKLTASGKRALQRKRGAAKLAVRATLGSSAAARTVTVR